MLPAIRTQGNILLGYDVSSLTVTPGSTLVFVCDPYASYQSTWSGTEQGAKHPAVAVYGGTEKFQSDEHWRDYVQFYEYFHGDNGAGLGASHQTGWTGLVAKLLQLFGVLDAKSALEGGKLSGFARGTSAGSSAKAATG
jgi:hypothetical protein